MSAPPVLAVTELRKAYRGQEARAGLAARSLNLALLPVYHLPRWLPLFGSRSSDC